MKPVQRQAQIAELVSRRGFVGVDALAVQFGVSAETIRRDLSELAGRDLLTKTHGGAKRPQRLAREGSFDERLAEDMDAKRRIAAKLVELISPGDTLFIDTGSTTLACAMELALLRDLTVITNSTRIAHVFAAGAGAADVHLLGGQYSARNEQVTGTLAMAQIAAYHADCAIIGMAGINVELGLMDADYHEACIARAMIQASEKLFAVAHDAKFTRRAAHIVCALDEIDALVSDAPPGSVLREACRMRAVELY
ncbi:MAG: DeoR/GlpR family DNA-binding transcription regulator [Aestuariivirgaceae bacterium]|nr:DeoR/GlpR family DNA-binding transcription regulator [Aestuariivirgaceae bacterium]